MTGAGAEPGGSEAAGMLVAPAVVALCHEYAALAGAAVAGLADFLADAALPGGHDVLLFSMILHDWDEPTNRELLAKAYAALPSGGMVIVSELLLDADRTGPAPAALMGMNMLVETVGEGRLKLIHANDSKDVVGAHKDRHENIGRGQIGSTAFAELMRHPATAGVPIIVETPAETDGAGHAADVATLKRLREGSEVG